MTSFAAGRVRCSTATPIDAHVGLCGRAEGCPVHRRSNGYPVIDDSLRVLGSYQPNWQGSVHGSVTFRQKLQLSFLVDVRNGGQAYNGTRGALYVYGTSQGHGRPRPAW